MSTGGRFIYSTNTGSNSISGYSVSFDGQLALLDPDGVTASTGGAPIDMDLSNDGRFLYALNSGDGTVTAFEHEGQSGALVALDTAGGLPPSSNGLAAR